MNKWIKCMRMKRSNAGSSHFRHQFGNARDVNLFASFFFLFFFFRRSSYHFGTEIIYAGSKFRGTFKWSAWKRTSGSDKMRNKKTSAQSDHAPQHQTNAERGWVETCLTPANTRPTANTQAPNELRQLKQKRNSLWTYGKGRARWTTTTRKKKRRRRLI